MQWILSESGDMPKVVTIMRILFIQKDAISESIGLCCLSAYLKQNGHDCDLLLLTHSRDWLEDIRNFTPDLIGFSAFTGMQATVYELICQVKKHFDIPIILGGPHPTFYPKECMEECPEIDMICRGDGEESLLKVVNALRNNEDYTNIPGIWVRQGEKIIENSISPLIENINALPFPDRSIYHKYSFLKNFPMKRFISGYGCPYKCSYCNEPFFEKEYLKEYSVNKAAFMRFKSVDYLIEEILSVKNNGKLKRLHFSNDIFFPNTNWLKEFASKYSKLVGVPFSCNLRFDLIDEERAKLLKKAMCYAVQSGIESGNDRMRNEVIGKQLARERIICGAKILRENGIKIFTTNIVALPGETLDDAMETIELNQQIKTDYIRINTLMPFPKTGISDYAIEHGYLPNNYSLKDLNTSDPLNIQCKTPFSNEFKNITCLFLLFVKLPFLKRFIRPIVRIKNNWFFRLIGFLNLFQEVVYFQIDLLSGVSFYFNTLFRLKDSDTMHWIPAMKKRN